MRNVMARSLLTLIREHPENQGLKKQNQREEFSLINEKVIELKQYLEVQMKIKLMRIAVVHELIPSGAL